MRRLLGPDTLAEEQVRKIPLLRQVYGFMDPAAIHQAESVPQLGIMAQVYRETQIARVRAAAMDWYQRAQQAFDFDAQGRARLATIAPDAPESKLTRTIFDIVEFPERYRLTPEQQAAVQEAQGLMGTVLAQEQAAGVDVNAVANYWHRHVVEGPRARSLFQRLTRPVGRGGAKGHTRSRWYEFAEQTVEAGYKLDTNPLSSLTHRLEAGVNAIADKETINRIARLPGMVKPRERIPGDVIQDILDARRARDAAKKAKDQVALEAARERLATAQTAYRQASKQARQPHMYEQQVLGKIAPAELVEEIDRWIRLPGRLGQRAPAFGLAEEAFRLYRSMLVSLDLSAGYIQGQQLFYRNHLAWWRAQAASIVSLANEPLSYVSKNYDIIDEGIKNGAISPPSEFLFAREGLSALPSKLPVVGQAFERTNRAFSWFTFVGQVELYRAARGNAQATAELVSLGSAIRKILGTESYAVLGVPKRQQAMEAWVAFAPRFYRALLGTIGQAFTPGPGGDAARKAFGAMLAGATAVTIGAHYASTRQMPNFTDPTRADWGKFWLRDSYVSAYGPFHSLFRTLARAGVYISQGTASKARTELARFFSSKASLPVRIVKTAAELALTGEAQTFEGEPIRAEPQGLARFLQEQAPIGPASIAEAVAEGRPEQLLEIAGPSVVPEGVRGPRDAVSMREFGKPYDALSKAEQNRLNNIPEVQAIYEKLPETSPSIQALIGRKEKNIRRLIDEDWPEYQIQPYLADYIHDGLPVERMKDPEVRRLFAEYEKVRPLLEQYDAVVDELVPSRLTTAWAAYKRASTKAQQEEVLRQYSALGLRSLVARLNAEIRRRRQELRRRNPELDEALRKWRGYADLERTAPVAPVERRRTPAEAGFPR